jgi:hypothetical protein
MKRMAPKTELPPFKDWFFNKFIEWEKTQPGRRSNQSVFARWLSENEYDVTIKQQLVSYWIKGPYEPTDQKYILVLASKLGQEIYQVLDVDPIDPLFLYVNRNWGNAPHNVQLELAKVLANYTKEPLPDEATKNPKTKPR